MTMADVVKTTVLLADINEFGAMNEVYGEFFAEPYPARAAFQVAALPKNAMGRDRSRRRQTLTDRFDERQPNGALHPRCVLSNRQNNRFIIVLGRDFFPTPVFV